jgi:hypothetical protein
MIAAALAAMSPFVMLGGAAQAQSAEGASLTLATARPGKLIQDGAQWRCDGLDCSAPRVKGLPAVHACKRLVGELGAVTAFTWRGKALDAAQLAECNTAAKR